MSCYSCHGNHPDTDDWTSLCEGLRHNPQEKLSIDQVKAVDAYWCSGAPEPEFVWLLELNNGQWAAASGGHDYTGWD